jgi:hypothetical protein
MSHRSNPGKQNLTGVAETVTSFDVGPCARGQIAGGIVKGGMRPIDMSIYAI